MKNHCLITGAAGGLGLELAKIFAAEGYKLILIDISKENLENSVALLEKEYQVEVISIEKDLSVPGSASEVFEEVMSLGCTVEVLINNAGFGYFGFFAGNRWEKQRDLINLSVLTSTNLIKLFLDGMMAKGYGKIMNVASLAAYQPGPLMSVYHASKAFLVNFSVALANELKGTGITMTVLCPGMMATGFQKANNNEDLNLKFTVGSAARVARYGYNALMKGKTVAIPGLMNKAGAFLPRLLPLTWTTNVVRKIQEKNRNIKA